MEVRNIDNVRAAQGRLAVTDPETGKPLKQAKAAGLLGIHPVTLNRIEAGKANVSLDLLERMVTLYECSREYLRGEEEQVDPIEEARTKFNAALTKIGDGYEDLTDAFDVLLERAREAGKVAVKT